MFPTSPFSNSLDFHGSTLTLSTGLLAKQATASVLATLGETTVLASVVVGSPRGADYFPLQVIFEEKYYAAGKIKSSRFVKREGKPSDQAVLTGRMIDRSLRSLFDADLRNDIQVIVTVLSVDEVHPPDVLGVLAASSALSLCGLGSSFQGPVSAVRLASRGVGSREELLSATIAKLGSTEDYEAIAEDLETLCQAYNLARPEDKSAFRPLFEAVQAANPRWTARLKQVYEASTRWSPAETKRHFASHSDLVVNPDYTQRTEYDLDLVVAGNGPSIMMIEAGSDLVSEDQLSSALDTAVTELGTLTKFQSQFIASVLKKREVLVPDLVTVTPPAAYTRYWQTFTKGLTKPLYATGTKAEKARLLSSYLATHTDNLGRLFTLLGTGKIQSLTQLQELVAKFSVEQVKVRIGDSELAFDRTISQAQVSLFDSLAVDKSSLQTNLRRAADTVIGQIIKDNILHGDKRVDGRALDETRQITCAVDVLPRVHGSALFTRGETQVLNALTVGTQRDAKILDGMEDFDEVHQRYIHHYNFPSYSVGENGRYGPPNRREIGHGALAEKALLPVLPDIEEFPYTLRLVSECLESNGSTSMASTCASTLSLMAGGVPIGDPVAGVAMGLMLDSQSGKFKVLTDIQGLEDHHGDMDFKVTGTAEGVTALQLDNKVAGLTPEILKQAIASAKQARLHILGIMKDAISEPRAEISPYAPRVEIIQVPFDKIGDVIGPGGKIIKGLVASTGCEIELNEDGTTYIYGDDAEQVQVARDAIMGLIKDFEVGDILSAKVTGIKEFGAFVALAGSKQEALIHVSELAPGRTDHPSDVVQMGQDLRVKIIDIKDGNRISASITALTTPDNDPGTTRFEKPKHEPKYQPNLDSITPEMSSTHATELGSKPFSQETKLKAKRPSTPTGDGTHHTPPPALASLGDSHDEGVIIL